VPALELLLQMGRQFSFEVIGPRPAMSDALRKRTKLRPHTGSYAQWIKVRNSLDWDLALAPLEESNFTACKYHNKFLEMASAAIPGVFSNVMPFIAAVADGVEGLLTPNTPLAWADCVEKLMDDPELRRRLAVNAWNKINRDNSPPAVVLSFVQQMKPALAHRAPGEPRVLGIVPWRLVGKPLIFLASLRALGLAGGLRRLARKILAPERVFAGLNMPRSEVLHLPKRTISGLEFRLGTHGRCLCGRVNLALCDKKTGEVLRHAQRDINDLEDNAVTAFAFDPLDAGALHKAVLTLQTDCPSPVAVYERRTSLLTGLIIKPLRMLKFAGPAASRRIWLNFLPRRQPTETNTPR
jgi:hypothetical protein